MEERGFISPSLAMSASYREGGGGGGNKGFSRRRSMRPSFEADNEVITLLHGSDPVRIELNRLENEVRDKDRELSEAQAEIKALKLSERQREKAVEELTEELGKMAAKLKLIENLLECKNLEIKKINEEKKASMAAQFAAEASLRRVHAAQKDDDMPPIEAILAPLEAELKLARQEIAKLQDDNRSLDRLTKSKEAALLDAERTVQSALAKASMVDDLQNKNQELMKQIEICQEENKIIDKMHRHKVAEVENLMQTVRELEEAVLAGGAAANAVRDYQRKFQEMNEERKILQRELARAKVNANRVATVVANEWKDSNDQVMPVRQWLEERRFLQGEMQQLRDKLTIVDRAAKSEAQLKEKFILRLRVLEHSLKRPTSSSNRGTPGGTSTSNGPSRRQSLAGAETSPKLTSNGSLTKRTAPSSQLRSLSSSASTILKHAKGTSISFDGGTRTLDRNKVLINRPGLSFPLNHQSSEGTSGGDSLSYSGANYSGDADSNIIRETWARLIEQALSLGGIAEACAVVKRVGSHIYPGDGVVLPLDVLCLHLEKAALERAEGGEYVGDEDIARALLAACKGAAEPVLNAYDRLLSNTAIVPSPNLRIRLFRSVLVVLLEWAMSVLSDRMGASPTRSSLMLGGSFALENKAVLNQRVRDKIANAANRYMTEVRRLTLPPTKTESVYAGFKELDESLLSSFSF